MPTHRAKHSQLGGTQSKQKKAETFEGSIFFFFLGFMLFLLDSLLETFFVSLSTSPFFPLSALFYLVEQYRTHHLRWTFLVFGEAAEKRECSTRIHFIHPHCGISLADLSCKGPLLRIRIDVYVRTQSHTHTHTPKRRKDYCAGSFIIYI